MQGQHIRAAGECSVLTASRTKQCCVARTQPAQPSGSRWLPGICMKGGYCWAGVDSWIALLKEQLTVLLSQAHAFVVALTFLFCTSHALKKHVYDRLRNPTQKFLWSIEPCCILPRWWSNVMLKARLCFMMSPGLWASRAAACSTWSPSGAREEEPRRRPRRSASTSASRSSAGPGWRSPRETAPACTGRSVVFHHHLRYDLTHTHTHTHSSDVCAYYAQPKTDE